MRSSDEEHDGLGTEEGLRRIEASEERHVVEQALAAARERLGMDAAYITTIGPEVQTIERVVDSTDAFAPFEGTAVPVEETYCIRMLRGDMPNVVPDTQAEPAVRDLEATRVVGAYAGVPVRLPDGRVHGTLCCVSAAPMHGLGAEELRFLQVLADMVAERLARAEGNLSRLLARTGEG